MGKAIATVTLGLLGSVAHAQPAESPPSTPATNVHLSVDDEWLLERGYITHDEVVTGVTAAFFIGFGLGQGAEGRWRRTGYIFTIGDTITMTMAWYGMFDLLGYCWENGCSDRREQRDKWLAIAGTLGIGGLRIWQVLDALIAPTLHNERLHDLQARITPYIAPARDRDGGSVVGMSFHF